MSISRKALRQELLGTPSGLLAGGLGSGLAPVAPGTFGSLAALIPGWFLMGQPLQIQACVIVAVFVIGIYVCERSGQRLGVADHGALVIDEFVGLWIVLVVAERHWLSILAAFALFRAFDIVKPPPIRQLEKRIDGGLGVMVDDVVAGLMAAVAYVLGVWALRALGLPA